MRPTRSAQEACYRCSILNLRCVLPKVAEFYPIEDTHMPLVAFALGVLTEVGLDSAAVALGRLGGAGGALSPRKRKMIAKKAAAAR
jgi:hypothetical protein